MSARRTLLSHSKGVCPKGLPLRLRTVYSFRTPPLSKTHTFSAIKLYPLVHPGRGPRALLLKKRQKISHMSSLSEQAINRGTQRSLPQAGGVAPPVAPVPAVGSLAQRMQHWRPIVKSEWILKTIEKGYRIQFMHSPPSFSRIIHAQPVGEAAHFLAAAIKSLLEKRAIQVVPPAQAMSGFYSRYFIIKKKGGGMRPILDLRALNTHLRRYRFRMLTHSALLRFVRPGDWFTTLDLADAYYHIRIYPPHRKFLRFAFQGVIYEFSVLPFGLSLSPRVFVKCTEAALGPLSTKGIRLATFIDDFLLAASSAQEAIAHTEHTMAHLSSLGFRFNLKKSVLTPPQSITFIGLSLDSVTMRA